MQPYQRVLSGMCSWTTMSSWQSDTRPQPGKHWAFRWPELWPLRMSFLGFLGICTCTIPSTEMSMNACCLNWHEESLTISMGLSSQWNLGRKMQWWPAPVMSISSMEGWLAKSSCLDSRRAMQQSVFSHGQTGEHLARMFWTLNPHSSSTRWRPFGEPSGNIMHWALPLGSGNGFDNGITVLRCLRCFLPSDLFISNAQSASGANDACADDWLKMKRQMQSGCASSNIWIASFNCAKSWFVSHQASLFAPG